MLEWIEEKEENDDVPLKDIESMGDIQTMINSFYSLAKDDDLIGKAFEGVDWDHHLPRMYQFWAFLLLNENYDFIGNPLAKHIALHARFPLEALHFDRWVSLFQKNIDNHFKGEKADQAKFKAFSIAATWKPKFS